MKKRFMKKYLNRRLFLKSTGILFISVLFIFSKRNFYISKKNNIKNIEFLKNFYFAKKKYHKETTDLIFTNFLKNKDSAKIIMDNIEKRRKLSKLISSTRYKTFNLI